MKFAFATANLKVETLGMRRRFARVLTGHSQLAHMRIRYNFIANLHITETQSILLLTKYDKNYRMSKKQVSQLTIENQAKHCED